MDAYDDLKDEENLEDEDLGDENIDDKDIDDEYEDVDYEEDDIVLLINGKRYIVVPEDEGEEQGSEEYPLEPSDEEEEGNEDNMLKDVDTEDIEVDDEYSPTEEELGLSKKKEGVEKNKLDSRKSISPSGDFPKKPEKIIDTKVISDAGKDLQDIPREQYAIKGDTKSGVKYTPSDAGDNKISISKLLKVERENLKKKGLSESEISKRLEEIELEWFTKSLDNYFRKKGTSLEEVAKEFWDKVDKVREENRKKSEDNTCSCFNPTEDLVSGIVDIDTKPVEIGMNPDSVTEPSDEEAKIAEDLKNIRKKRLNRQSE